MRRIDEEKLERTLQFIRDFQFSNGKAPNYRQIKDGCKFSSLATVALYVDRLKDRGYIDTDSSSGWNRIRTPDNIETSDGHDAFLVGNVHCGPPTETEENIEARVVLPDELFGSGDHVILHAEGPSMIKRGIFDGDLLVVRRTPIAELGQTVIAVINKKETTCKVYDQDGGRPYFRAANDTIVNGKRKYDVYPKGEWEIYGIVDYVIHAPVCDEL